MLQLVETDHRRQLLQKTRYHWASYVARGGFSSATTNVGELEEGGIRHWTLFLQYARQYLREYPKDGHIIEGFVPTGLIKLITGE